MDQPNDGLLLKAKTLYGSLGVLEIEEQLFYYRSLTPAEILTLKELEESLPENDWAWAIVNMAVIWPTDFTLDLAGSIFVLQNAVLEASLPTDDKGNFRIEDYRGWAKDTVENNASYALAVAVANNYPPANIIDLLNMPMENLLRMAALVEKILDQDIFSPNNTKGAKTDPANELRRAINQSKK